MLFTAAKIAHLSLLPQGQPERFLRVKRMVAQMDAERFGNCTNHRECEAACPKAIPIETIARLNRDFLRAGLRGERRAAAGGAG
jgi:succinate dehydrogenase / fumarate reductase iron-sulfur subunit